MNLLLLIDTAETLLVFVILLGAIGFTILATVFVYNRMNDMVSLPRSEWMKLLGLKSHVKQLEKRVNDLESSFLELTKEHPDLTPRMESVLKQNRKNQQQAARRKGFWTRLGFILVFVSAVSYFLLI